MADRRGRQQNAGMQELYGGLTTQNADGKPVFNGTWRFVERMLDVPLRTRKPTVYFVGSETDLFGEGVGNAWLTRVFAVMALAPQHLFLLLTKRPARMRKFISATTADGCVALGNACDILVGEGVHLHDWPLPNVWLGGSVEHQAAADERIPELLTTPAAKRFISAEPLLGPIDLCVVAPAYRDGEMIAFTRAIPEPGRPDSKRYIDWVIVGGESGPGARPMHPDWARSLRDQCAAAGTDFFFKQWGEFGPEGLCSETWIIRADGSHDEMKTPNGIGHHPPRHGSKFVYRVGKKAAGHLLDGREHREVPA